MKKLIILAVIILTVFTGCKNINMDNVESDKITEEESMVADESLPETEENISGLSDIELEQKEALSEREWKLNEKSTLEEAYADMEELPKTEIEIANEYPFTGEYKDVFPVVNNSEPLENMISEIKNPLYVHAATSSLGFSYVNNTGISLYDILCNDLSRTFLDSLPINFLRKNPAGNYYTVFKLEGGGYVYYYFVERYDERVKDYEKWEDYERFSVAKDDTDLIFQGAVYVEETLSYRDTKKIKEGDSILDIAKIAPSVMMTLNLRDFYRDVNEYQDVYDIEYVHVLMLEDGILELVFGPGKELKLTEKNYFRDYNYYPSDISYNNYYDNFCLNLEILPQDYPPAE